jgi:uncharacterized protein
MNNKKIIIAGGTGFIGQALANWLGSHNEVTILTRGIPGEQNNTYSSKHSSKATCLQWDGKTIGNWAAVLDGADVLINLAGKSVNCRYTAKNKQEIFDSRTNANNVLGLAVKQAVRPPKLWINAASATIYRHAMDRPQDEETGETGTSFSVEVCQLWEKTFFEQRTPFTRKVALRMAIALGSGGVMIPYFNLLKFGLGGKQGSGSQMYSWVHITDLCRMVEWIEEHNEMEGVYNCSSPFPVSNNEFMQTLRKATGHIIGLPAYTWMLKMGAAIIGTETELLLKSRWVLPAKMEAAGFQFTYPLLKDAFEEIIGNTPRKKYHLF